ncbi:ABC transporter permease subunit [Mesorhizobium sp. NBSH29]|uniref:ABC transporter permease n=1 Tax=Mesorhizobium sp. NBSH29 TaxID=2654249 RepID=UPI0018969891|nr:ABC transporter permease subunit [Mesorhizobium sp. NBSH29]QPC86271.1 ABC transporter permease subunit [Mesorhizobium sp. NBSH29]
MLPRLGPPLAILLLAGPIIAGLLGTLLPAFGYLPALGGNDFTTSHFQKLANEPGIGTSAALAIIAGLVTTAISLAVVMLFVAGWAGTRIFARIQQLISPLLAVPHAAAAFGLAFLIAPSGMLSRLVSPELSGWQRPPDLLIVHDAMGLSMIAGLVVKEIPFLLLVTLAALPQVDLARTRLLTASLGYGRVSGFVFGVWPPVYAQIRLAVFAAIAFATSVVDVAAILGPTAPATLAVRLTRWMQDPDLSMRFFASAGALLQLGVTVSALLAWVGMERVGSAICMAMSGRGHRFRHDRTLRNLALAAMLLAALTVASGLVTLGIWSCAGLWQFPDMLPQQFSARAWQNTAPRIGAPLATTFLVAALSTLIAVFLAVLCLIREGETGRSNGRSALLFIYLPLIVPQVAFLFGLQLMFVLSGTVASMPALVLAHLIFVMPYVFLSLSDPWRAYDRRYEAVAAGLGKRRWTTLFRVRLPMLLRAVLTAAAVGFAVSVGQYLPTLLIGAGRLDTITTEAVALASGGNRRVIGVYAFLQLILPILGFAVATLLPALIFRNRRALRA